MLCGVGIPAGKVSYQHPTAELVSVGAGCCGNGWDGESPTSSCNSVHCSSGMAHTSSGVSKCLCHCLLVVTSRTHALLFCSALC